MTNVPEDPPRVVRLTVRPGLHPTPPRPLCPYDLGEGMVLVGVNVGWDGTPVWEWMCPCGGDVWIGFSDNPS